MEVGLRRLAGKAPNTEVRATVSAPPIQDPLSHSLCTLLNHHGLDGVLKLGKETATSLSSL